MARSAIISFYDWAQYPGVTVSGGPFETEFPAENMLTLQPQKVARGTGSSVSITVNLGTTHTIGLIHLQNLITDPSGTIQVTCGSYDSGVVGSWPADGAVTYSQLLYTALGRPRVFIPDTPVSASSVSINVNGGAGITMVGFVGVCEIFETPSDILAGDIITVQDGGDIRTIPFGSTYVTPRYIRRMIDCSLPPMPDHFVVAVDNFRSAFDLAMINGKVTPVIVVKYPDDADNIERNSVWGLISNDVPFTNRFFGYHDIVFQVKQLV